MHINSLLYGKGIHNKKISPGAVRRDVNFMRRQQDPAAIMIPHYMIMSLLEDFQDEGMRLE